MLELIEWNETYTIEKLRSYTPIMYGNCMHTIHAQKEAWLCVTNARLCNLAGDTP